MEKLLKSDFDTLFDEDKEGCNDLCVRLKILQNQIREGTLARAKLLQNYKLIREDFTRRIESYRLMAQNRPKFAKHYSIAKHIYEMLPPLPE